MNRVWVAIVGVALCSALGAQSAGAQKKRKPAAAAAPTSAQIAGSMGELRWGMGKDELTKKFISKTKAQYAPLIAKTRNPVEEDRLRNQEAQELEAITKGWVDFNGRTGGWDVSFLKGEFMHNTGEAMLVVRDRNSQNFYFFIDGKLWKWYKAFDAEVFPADDFKAFQASVEKRFGAAKPMQAELRTGTGERHWLEWQDAQSRLRAIDETDFYGFYCLVFEQKAVSEKIAKLRGGVPESGPKRHALVESVTAEREGHLDSAPDIADRISGHIRERPASDRDVATNGAPRAKERAPATPPSAAERAPRPPTKSDDDPLEGLGL